MIKESTWKRLENARGDLAKARDEINRILASDVIARNECDHIPGTITSVLVAMHHGIEEVKKTEIRHVKDGFRVANRGTGRDWVPYCFVCGKNLEGFSNVDNISMFVESKEDGESIVDDVFSGRARLDYRPEFPDRIQLKAGTCGIHTHQLDRLSRMLTNLPVISKDIVEECKSLKVYTK